MDNKLMVFKNNEFGEIRSLTIDNEPYFVAKDACKILGLKNTTAVINRLDTDERTKFNLGRQGETNVVNEYGLYSLILASRKKEAKQFKRWITHEVLPAIRKTGGYIAGEENYAEDELILKAMNVLNSKVENLRNENKKLLDENKELKPKANYADLVLKSDNLTKINVIACDYGYSAIEFNRLLKKFRIQYKQGDDWVLYQNYRGNGYTQTETFTYTRSNGTTGARVSMKWTQKGRLFLYDFLKARGIYPRMETKRQKPILVV